MLPPLFVQAMPDGEKDPATAAPAAQPTAIQLLMQHSPADEIPCRVMVAMSFVKLCNDYTGYWGMMGGSETGVESVVRELELSGPQQGALQRACVCLGRYFDGQDVDQPVDSQGGECHDDAGCGDHGGGEPGGSGST